MKFLNFFLLLWAIFALLDPKPDSEYGSGSTDPIESGSNWDPDPQPWFKFQIKIHAGEKKYVQSMSIRILRLRMPHF
jgi:hypothetical protein